MNDWRQEALTDAYRQLASGLSALLRVYREALPNIDPAPRARDMVAGALAQLEELGVTAIYIQEECAPGRWLDDQVPTTFSIEWVAKNPGPCSLCTAKSIGRGPIGWLKGSGPVCDGCMLARAWGLGSILLAVNVMREMGSLDETSSDDPDEAVVALMTYARLYERVAADLWPHRPVGLLGYLRHLIAKFKHGPAETGNTIAERLFRQGDIDENGN